MSFSGITFSNRKVTPSSDAMIRASIIRDGVLQGCELEYAGFTLSMGAGHILLLGRAIQHDNDENWAVSQATSGYARLLVTVDLSRTSTIDVFDQITSNIEYSASLNDFPVLNTSDINADGVKYQCEICVVSLGSGGITGIVRQLGRAGLMNSAIVSPVPMHRGGHGANSGQAGLKNLLESGYMIASGYQIVDSVEDIPADAPVGSIFFVPMEE